MNTDFIIGASGLYLGDMLFVLISFILLFALVKHFAWGPVSSMMKSRSDKIANDLDFAEKSRKDADELAQKRDAELKQSRAQASEIVTTARETGDKQRQEIIDNAQTEAQQLKENAQKDIDQQRKDALKGVQDQMADISVEIASKIIGKQLSADDQKDLIDSYIEGLGKSNGSR